MTDPFATLGVPRHFRLDMKMLEQRHRDLSRVMHPDKHVQAAPAERRIALERAVSVNDAFRALKNPQSRAAALLATAGRTVEEGARADSALLMEIMELREELETARASKGAGRAAAVAALKSNVEQHVKAEEDVIAEVFDTVDAAPPPDALERAYNALVKLRYFYRFLEEAEMDSEE